MMESYQKIMPMSTSGATGADESNVRIVTTPSGKQGTVVRRSLSRVYVRLWLDIGSSGNRHGRQRVPAKVIVAYRWADVVAVGGGRV
jgi:hypothetical protein